MKLFLTRPVRSDVLVVATYWLVALLVIFPSYVVEFGWLRAVVAMLYNIVLDTAAVYFIVFGFLPLVMETRTRLVALLLIPTFLLLSGVLYKVGYGLILHLPITWTPAQFISSIIRHGQSYGVLGIMLVGKGYFDMQRRLLLAHKAQTESELKNLKAQIDPHFLFNNLNILYALIQQDKQVASHYLSCFSALYRYLIRHKDDDFVPLADELKFVDEYIYLLNHRFGQAYTFHKVMLTEANLDSRFVVPATLQILVENAIKHNRGDEDNPLAIVISVSDETVSVSNKIRPKLTPVESTGTGLLNLKERYKILSNKEMQIYRDGFFEVLVPVIKEWN
ncbi:histidine kinase [Hymenobacter gummosus]|uniref:Histidine kinase n=1 Tax=Hymenobacter gummosus TaxID=1776032 RepID=A0A3S0QEW5_9BACT|nr:sensor histidine kinase [Hymenobacter gummosus]RTQ45904.1 histidine kinase [Hymenobacter gummosus]